MLLHLPLDLPKIDDTLLLNQICWCPREHRPTFNSNELQVDLGWCHKQKPGNLTCGSAFSRAGQRWATKRMMLRSLVQGSSSTMSESRSTCKQQHQNVNRRLLDGL